MARMVGDNGSAAAIVSKQLIPKMYKVRQKFDDCAVGNIDEEVQKILKRPGTLDKIKPGQSIAITAGSRGIANLSKIIKAIIDEVKCKGGKPFVVPTMGSHGGASAEGQREVIASFGITEETMGCPVRSSMETVQVGVSEYGLPVRIDKLANEADGIIVVGRVKPHTSFRGKLESGLCKMITIGLGKQYGAEICHAQGFRYMEKNITSIAAVVLQECKILFGVAIIENAYDKTKKLEAVPAEKIFDEEPILLEEAKSSMPSIMFDEVDVLIIDKIGKDISGAGMDPNISGTFTTPYASGGLKKQRIVALDLTEESHGNGVGVGLADFIGRKLFDKLDFEKIYTNCLTSTVLTGGRVPLVMANDKLAIQAGIKTCNCIDYDNPRIVRIKNTLKLGEIMISEALLQEAENNPRMEVLEGLEGFTFNDQGNLF
ncbi:MAG: lactate racemase domain-containing protein [Clostridia bacterium]